MAIVLVIVLGAGSAVLVIERGGLAPRLVGPYLERRASGHNVLIERAMGFVAHALVRLDRGEPGPVHNEPKWVGAMLEGSDFSPVPVSSGREVVVADVQGARLAIDNAIAGDIILFAPGTYHFAGEDLYLAHGGRSDAPITIRAARLGTVTLEFDLQEGFHVAAAYWTFENLAIRGVCPHHDDCEHAFHIVGGAQHVLIRNNMLSEFNAQIKINGESGLYPDAGRIEHNTLVNSAARDTDNPVTSIDLVAANDWLIEGNLIADFVKARGDQTSYGAFAKGAGAGNRFMRNAVLCENRLRGITGRRIGLSFGGGGTAPEACRDRRCIVEQERGTMESNLVMSCSDDGIYVNRASQTRLLLNTVIDTAGVLVRFPVTFAFAAGNLVDGTILAKDGARLEDGGNQTSWVSLAYLGMHPVRWLFENTDTLDLRWASGGVPFETRGGLGPDLCGVARSDVTTYGAFVDFRRCLERAPASPINFLSHRPPG